MVVNHEFRNYTIVKQCENEANLGNNLKDNPKLFYSYIRKKVGAPSIGPLRSLDGHVETDSHIMSELFASAFSSVFTANIPEDPSPHQVFNEIMPEVDVLLNDVFKVISKLDSFSSMGPDDIHPYLLKSCSVHLSYPLWLIFRSSLLTASIPSVWKKSLVVPIYKKGSRYDPLNYRPVSLTSVPGKCMEHILTKVIYEFIESNNLFNKDQFGFR